MASPRLALLSSLGAVCVALGCSATGGSTGNGGSPGSGNTGNVGTGNTGNVGTGNTGNVGTGNTGNVGTGNTGNVGTANGGTGNVGTGNGGTGNTGNVGTGNTGNVGTANGGTGNVGTGNGGTGNTGNVGTGNTGNVGTANGGSGNTGNTPGNGGTGVVGAGGTAMGQGGTSTGNGGTTNTGNGGTAGSTSNGTPAGYWTSKDWKGCSWTGKGTLGATTVMPQDFVAKAASAPYCISGVVGAEPAYKSVALLGFNVNETNPATCAYKPVDVTASGPPSVTPMANGIAVNFVKRGADTSFTLRVQIQGPNGAKEGPAGDADRWCATLTEVQGKVFVPYSSFTPKCWELTDALKGTPYAKQPISAVVFNVPGKLTDTAYDFCVNGLAYGTTADDAPDGTAVGGDQKGTVGGTGARDLDFARAKVNVDGENYIIQNNNWGNPDGTDLILSYVNNSFKITSGSGSGASAPASFPSIYIGNNGNTANGVYSTKTTDNMPIQISAITSIPSTFRYSGSTGNFNATYDIWFANSPPTAEYQDGIDGFVMIWLRDPSGKQPIGSQVGTATIAGQTWNVWKGPRGDGPAGYNDAPVVSFLNPAEDNDSRAQSFVNVNIKEFLTAAAAHGIPATMYLTDVFAGFEIWQGGAGGNLSVDEFKCVVNK